MSVFYRQIDIGFNQFDATLRIRYGVNVIIVHGIHYHNQYHLTVLVLKLQFIIQTFIILTLTI